MNRDQVNRSDGDQQGKPEQEHFAQLWTSFCGDNPQADTPALKSQAERLYMESGLSASSDGLDKVEETIINTWRTELIGGNNAKQQVSPGD